MTRAVGGTQVLMLASRLHTVLAIGVVGAMARAASAQPVDPYGAPPAPAPAPAPAPTPAPPPVPASTPAPGPTSGPQDPYTINGDPVLAEQVADSLVSRAQELLDAKIYVDAKQLAVEALVESAKGPAADHARYIIKVANQQLGIREEVPGDHKPPVVDHAPIVDPTLPVTPVTPPAEGHYHSGHTAAMVHAGIYSALIGATIGSYFDTNNPASGAVPMGIGAGLLGAILLPRAIDKLNWSEAQVRTAGAASVWAGVVGGLFGNIATGANGGSTDASDVLTGAAIGSTVGALAGGLYASNDTLTRGDVALVDTFAGMGAVGGLTIGMLMQPAQTEGYSLNAALGTAAGVVTGLIVAPHANTTPRRMLRVAGLAAAGGAVPFLLYAGINDPSTTADERVTGLLSTAGLVAGAWLGFYLTRNMDKGLDVKDTKPSDAPPAIVGRSSDGRWDLGPFAVSPLSPALAPQKGLALTVVGGAF